jgi:hypothetical protein
VSIGGVELSGSATKQLVMCSQLETALICRLCLFRVSASAVY